MKKKLIGLLSLVLLVTAGVKDVNAAVVLEEGTTFTRASQGSPYSVSGLYIGDNQYTAYNSISIASNGTNYAAYCLDPNQKNMGTNMYVDRMLLDPDSSDTVRAYDAGLLSIISQGYNQAHTWYSNDLTQKDFYEATSIAVRAWTLGLFKYGRGAAEAQGALSSGVVNLGIQWASYDAAKASKVAGISECKELDYDKAVTCFQALPGRYYNWYDSSIKMRWDSGSQGWNIINVAKRLYDAGLKAAYDVLENGSSSLAIEVSSKTEKVSNTEEYLKFTFTVNNLPKDGYVKGVTLDCPDCNANGINLSYLEVYDGSRYHRIDQNFNIAQYLNDKNQVEVRVLVTKSEKDECQPAKYTLNYVYKGLGEEYIGAIVRDQQNPQGKQRYAVVAKADASQNNEIAAKKTGNINCSQEACETEISVPKCSLDQKESTSTIKAPEKIKTCVLEKSDEAGNSYQLTEDNGGVDNDYCSVFCKEDYAALELNPIVENVKCGGFFKLKAHIDGSKDCYTSGGKDTDYAIDREKYLADIIDAQKRMISNYDLYMKAKTADGTIDSSESSCGCCGGNCENWFSRGEYQGVTANDPNYDTGYVSYEVETKNYSYSDSCRNSCRRVGEDRHCTGSCNSGKKSVVQGDIDDDMERAEKGLKEALEDLENAIKDYNSCTTVWTNKFLFEQKIKYEYAEKDYYGLLSDSQKYLEAVEDSFEVDTEIEVCTGSVDENYKCQNGSEIIDVDDDSKLNLDDYNYDSQYDDAFTKRTYTKCTTGGCNNINPDISDAKYVRKTVKKSQDYITPTVFYQIYPSGKITVNGDYQGASLQLNPLENKLPVATSTVGGGAFKLIIEDLGEFYTDGESGRLIDFEGEHEEESIAHVKGENSDDTFSGEYVCRYESPCRPDDCPDCDFSCEGEYCEFTECPDCKVTCVNCLFDLSELQLNFKTVSTTNFASANREYGYNWNVNTEIGELKLIKEKAEATIEEIVEKNETIYDSTTDSTTEDKDTSSSNLAFSIKMTPSVTQYIKDYNDKVEDEKVGGYANDTLTCYDYNDYANILCYSDFLDDLINKFDGEGLVTVKNRTEVDKRATNPNSDGYWTLWDGYVYNESVIGGPSWK